MFAKILPYGRWANGWRIHFNKTWVQELTCKLHLFHLPEGCEIDTPHTSHSTWEIEFTWWFPKGTKPQNQRHRTWKERDSELEEVDSELGKTSNLSGSKVLICSSFISLQDFIVSASWFIVVYNGGLDLLSSLPKGSTTWPWCMYLHEWLILIRYMWINIP